MSSRDGWREAPDYQRYREHEGAFLGFGFSWNKDNRTNDRDADRLRRQRRGAFRKRR